MATYFTTFNEYSTGSPPSDWSLNGATSSEATVETFSGATSGYAFVVNADPNGRFMSFTWNDIAGTETDIETVMRFQCPGGFQGFYTGVGPIVRVQDAVGQYAAYSARVNNGGYAGPNALARGVYGGYATELDTASVFSGSASTWYWVRLRANGTNIRAWFWTHGDAEKTNADTPDCEVTDSTYTAGSAGFARDFTAAFVTGIDLAVDVFGVGTAGDAAPTSGGAVSYMGPKAGFYRMMLNN